MLHAHWCRECKVGCGLGNEEDEDIILCVETLLDTEDNELYYYLYCKGCLLKEEIRDGTFVEGTISYPADLPVQQKEEPTGQAG